MHEITITAATWGGDSPEEICLGVSATKSGKLKIDHCYINSDFNNDLDYPIDRSKSVNVTPVNACFIHFPPAYLFNTLHKNGYEFIAHNPYEDEGDYDGLWDYLCKEIFEQDVYFGDTPVWFQRIQMD